MDKEKLSKKEKRNLAKEQKRQDRERLELVRKIKKLVIAVFVLGAIGFVGYKAYLFMTTPVEIDQNILLVKEDDWIKGASDAQATLIEYSDFECPACAAFYPVINRLAEDYPEDLRIIYRHFPLTQSHKNAFSAAVAAEAAGRQGKFWEMHDILFEEHDDWFKERNPRDKFISYANEINLDEAQFKIDLEDSSVTDNVSSDLAGANQLRLNSTPTLFLNGEKVNSLNSYSDLTGLIERKISEE